MDWRDIVGFEGLYQVSDCGLVRNRQGKILKPRLDKDGYNKAALSKNTKYYYRLIHRLMLEAFVGPAPEGKPCGCHNDDNVSNNTIQNLRWDSHTGNMRQAVVRGTHSCMNQRKLFDNDLIAVKHAHRLGVGAKAVAAYFGVHESTIYRHFRNSTL